MSHITRITAVGLLIGALTSNMVQALPIIPKSLPVQRTEAVSLLELAVGWLSPLLGGDHGRTKHGTTDHHGSVAGHEKEGTVLDPNGQH